MSGLVAKITTLVGSNRPSILEHTVIALQDKLDSLDHPFLQRRWDLELLSSHSWCCLSICMFCYGLSFKDYSLSVLLHIAMSLVMVSCLNFVIQNILPAKRGF